MATWNILLGASRFWSIQHAVDPQRLCKPGALKAFFEVLAADFCISGSGLGSGHHGGRRGVWGPDGSAVSHFSGVFFPPFVLLWMTLRMATIPEISGDDVWGAEIWSSIGLWKLQLHLQSMMTKCLTTLDPSSSRQIDASQFPKKGSSLNPCHRCS